MTDSNDHPEYVWRFKLSDERHQIPDTDALTEMVRSELKALLGCVALTHGGVDLKVTGFRFLGEPDEAHALYPGERAQQVAPEGAFGSHNADEADG